MDLLEAPKEYENYTIYAVEKSVDPILSGESAVAAMYLNGSK